MKYNVGKNDKIIRSIIALIFIYFGYIYSPWLYIVSGILLLTVIFKFCPIYKLFGFNTYK